MRFLLFAAALAMTVTAAMASEATIAIPTADGVDKVSYDSSRLKREDVMRWMQLSPHVIDSNDYLVPEALELCIDGSNDYLPCGSRDIQDPNFFKNAEVNLSNIQKRIEYLGDSSYPQELRPVVNYIKAIQSSGLQWQERRLAYLKTNQLSDLSGKVAGIDIDKACSSTLNDLAKAPEYKAAYQLVWKDWSNCVNSAVRKQLGPYPMSAWDNFLRTYRIKESFVPRQED